MLRRRHICMAAAIQLLGRLIIVWELRVVDSATAICCGAVRVKDRIRDSLVFTSERAMTQSQYALNRMIMVTTKISTTKGTRTMVTTKVTLPMATQMRIQVTIRFLMMTSRIGLTIDMQTIVFALYPHTYIGKRQLLWFFSAIIDRKSVV